MRVTELRLVDFRSYEAWHLVPDPSLTILVGANAAGKTNAIEALQLVTSCRSFRNPKWGETVRWGADRALVHMSAEGEDRRAEIDLDISSSGGRTYRVNGSSRRGVAQVAGTVPSVTFTPDDLAMVKGSAELRRTAIDETGEQLSETYGSLRREYDRVLRQRNRLLREGLLESLDEWTDQLVRVGARLSVHRQGLVARLAAAASDRYAELSGGETLEAAYVASARGQVSGAAARNQKPHEAETDLQLTEETMRDELQRRAEEERVRSTTLVGPHRDDVSFEVGGRNARAYASQGQQRTLALAWKLAEIRVVEDVTGRTPVLLLDDVMSELDETRRAALIDVVRDDIQTFITTTNLGYFEPALVERASVIGVAE